MTTDRYARWEKLLAETDWPVAQPLLSELLRRIVQVCEDHSKHQIALADSFGHSGWFMDLVENGEASAENIEIGLSPHEHASLLTYACGAEIAELIDHALNAARPGAKDDDD